MPKRYALLVDIRRCVGCTSCQVSCKMENAVPMDFYRAKVDIADRGEYPQAKRFFFPKLCNNCDNPPCVLPCPVPGATYRRAEDGVVMVNRDLCIGCGRCVKGCPYGARFLHPYIPVKNDPAKFAKDVPEVKGKKAKDLRVVDKCDYCSHRLAAGIEEPACVRNCAGRARYFGDLNDPDSPVSKLKASARTEDWHPEYGTKPMTPYIAPDKEVFSAADGPLNEAGRTK
ncbi:MAG TPA: 4Fe-4S dicluster domain-containing protein [Thermodesulfobacteriota bacterium]|nr:4Fe-4S dicluster domain-containing protein [Thermodesulfobacteriota bacterium]